MNYFSKLYEDLIDQLEAEVPELRWIDQDFGQLEIFEMRPAVSFPCALIDFQDTRFQELSQNVQWADVTVIVRIGFAPFAGSNNKAPDSVREQALAYYQLEQKVYEALHGWETDYTQPLTRTNSSTERRNDSMRVRAITFTTAFQDNTGMDPSITTPASPLIQYFNSTP